MTVNRNFFSRIRTLAVCIFVMCGVSVFGLDSAVILSRYPKPVSGEYVIYRDYSWKAPTWTGFLCYDDSTWGAFTWTPSTGSRVSILFRTEESDGVLILTGQQIISTITNADVPAVNYLMSLLPDMFHWHMELKTSSAVRFESKSRKSLLPPKMTLPKTLENFGGDVVLSFSPEVPLFNLSSLTSVSGAKVLSLYRSGRLGEHGDKDFFSFVAVDDESSLGVVEVSDFFVPDSHAVSEIRSVDGVTLKLDSQWTMMADNVFFMGNTAVLIVDTFPLSQSGFSDADIPLALSRLFSISSSTAWIDPEGFVISGSSKRFRIENRVRDVSTGASNQDIKICIPSKDGVSCTVISLSVTSPAWKAHRSYFDSIF